MTSDARRRIRRFGLVLLLFVLVLGGAAASLPWVVRLPAVHRTLAVIANSILAPGSVEFAPVRLSWFGATEIPDVILRDAEGDAVLVAPRMTFEWGLWQMVVTRPSPAHLDVQGAKLDIERRPDGTIDLHETLRPILFEHPRYQILIHLEDSRVRVRDRMLDEPFLADDLDARLDMGRGYEPISWKISMVPEGTVDRSRRLELEGSYSRARIDSSGRHDTNATLRATGLPFAMANPDQRIKVRGLVEGTVDAQLQSGLWLSKGETRFSRVELTAPALTEPLQVDDAAAAWDVKGTESGLMVERLTLESPLVSLRAEGSVPAVTAQGAWIETDLKLAELTRHLPATLRPKARPAGDLGALRVRADLRAGADGLIQNCDVRCMAHEFGRLQGPRDLPVVARAGTNTRDAESGDVVLGARATYDRQSDQLELTDLALKLSYLELEGAGAIRNLASTPVIDIQGTLNPNWSAVTALLAQHVEPNARITGRPRSWRVAGAIASNQLQDALAGLRGELGIQVDELDVFGMRLSKSAVVMRAENGQIKFDPIDAKLNQGRLHLEPELMFKQNGHTRLWMGESSTLDGAVINDEVSHRVLSYAAPILDGATRVKGKISVRLREAELPIVASRDAHARIFGELSFDDVRFVPGRLADQLLAVFDKQDQPLLVLRNSISFEIQNRKVHQKGLVIPVANLASIALDGSVDFDRNLDVVARLAVSQSAPVVSFLPPLLRNAQVDIPIRGTMQHPRIDTGGFRERLADIGMDFFGNRVGAGLDRLKRLFRKNSDKRLGDQLIPRAQTTRPASPADPENADPEFEASRKGQTTPVAPKPDVGGAEINQDTDESGG
jgi:hypothetical protein